MSASEGAGFDGLVGLIHRASDDGQPRWSLEAREDLVAALLLAHPIPPEALTPALLEALKRFADRVGLVPGLADAEAAERIRGYFAANPLPPELVAELGRPYQAGPVALSTQGGVPEPTWTASELEALALAGEPPKGPPPGGAVGYFAAQSRLPSKGARGRAKPKRPGQPRS